MVLVVVMGVEFVQIMGSDVLVLVNSGICVVQGLVVLVGLVGFEVNFSVEQEIGVLLLQQNLIQTFFVGLVFGMGGLNVQMFIIGLFIFLDNCWMYVVFRAGWVGYVVVFFWMIIESSSCVGGVVCLGC